MKESTIATRAMIAVLCIGVFLYMVIYVVQSWDENLVTVTAYAYEQDIGIEAPGLIFREETVLPNAGGYVDQILAEGERAAAGDAVALLYSDASALSTRQAIRTLTAELEQLEYVKSSGSQNADAAKIDTQIVSSIASLRALTASGNLAALEDAALNLRTAVFRRDYTYGNTGSVNELDQLIADKQAELGNLNRSMSQVSRAVVAPSSGVFSASVDGWEGVARPELLESLTIDGLKELMAQRPVADSSSVGKLITGSTWYLAVILPGADTGLQEGSRYSVSFSNGYYDYISMRLERISLEEDQTLAIFSARSNLADTTLLREQTVTVMTRQIEGIRIPRRALRVELETVENEDGTTSEVNRYYVYTIPMSQAEKQEVTVVYTADNYYLVRPVKQDATARLRAGDEVIVSASGVYDGKVVR